MKYGWDGFVWAWKVNMTAASQLKGIFWPLLWSWTFPFFFSIYISGTTVFINVRSIITNAWDRITYAEEPKTLSSSPIFQSFPRMFTAKNRHLTVDLQGLDPTRPHTWSRKLYSIFLSVINVLPISRIHSLKEDFLTEKSEENFWVNNSALKLSRESEKVVYFMFT